MKKLEKVTDNKELVKDLLLKLINETEEDCFYDEIYSYEFLLKNLNENVELPNTYVLIEEAENKNILDILYISESYGYTVVEPHFLFNDENVVLFLKKQHPDWLIFAEYVDLSVFGYSEVSLRSRLNSKYMLHLTNHGVLYKYDISSDIVSVFEKSLFPQDLSNLTFEWISHDDFEKSISTRHDSLFSKLWDKSGFALFYGFHYFKPEITYLNCHYLIAKDSEGRYVGVIKTYDKDGHYTIGYIDVFYGVRNQGIAKKMISELKKHFTKKQPVYLTALSDCGKKCHIDEIFKRILSDYEIRIL